VEGVRGIVERETCNNNSRALNSKALYELQYSIPSVDCTRELSGSYNGNQRGPVLAHTATVTLVVTDPSDFSISVEPTAATVNRKKPAIRARADGLLLVLLWSWNRIGCLRLRIQKRRSV
jgi:hypothetical protein